MYFTTSMIREILAPIICFVLLLLIINSKRYFKSASISKNILLIGFSIKAFSAILFGYLFKTGMLSGGDTYIYFDDANIVHSAMFLNPFVYLKLLLGFNDFTPVPTVMQPYTDNMHFWFDSSNYFVVRVNTLSDCFLLVFIMFTRSSFRSFLSLEHTIYICSLRIKCTAKRCLNLFYSEFHLSYSGLPVCTKKH